jgi:ATP-dependent protease ClpP protease subunit
LRQPAVSAKDAPKTTYIKFLAGVTQQSINTLMQVVDAKLKEGTKRFILLISSPGGNVFYGLTRISHGRIEKGCHFMA